MLALAILASGCAWSNPENRPVWNAFEEHLVPEDDVLFAVTLPLTLPGGFGAILIDSLFVHPVQVVDDAAGDARDVWNNMEWSEQYYTELATLPLRAVGTPLVFVGSFLGRSIFDAEPHKDAASSSDVAHQQEVRRVARRLDVQKWLESVAAGRSEHLRPQCEDCGSWSDELQFSFEATRRAADADGRLELYRAAERNRWPPWEADPGMGLRDPDPVVRYMVLQNRSAALSKRDPIPEDLQRELREDPSEMVRLLARKLFPAED